MIIIFIIALIITIIVTYHFSTKFSQTYNQLENDNIENNNVSDLNNELRNENIENNKSDEENNEYKSEYDGSLGTAGSLKGQTVIVSIFANDENTNWNLKNKEDLEMIDDTLDNLKIATEYLSKNVSKYNETATFIYDWKEYNDLKYVTSFDQNLVTADGIMYYFQKEYIEQNINTDNLKNKYKADNVIYMFYFNTDYSNSVNPWSLGHSNGDYYNIEIINIFVKFDDYFVTSPASYAHEIMHTFGAHDLYYANEFINQEYVNHCLNSNSNDIMFTVSDGKTISVDFTDLDAYYVGLIDKCKEVEKWGLGKSEHN